MFVIPWMMLSLIQIISSEYISKYNILMLTSPLGSHSHSIYFHAIAKQLAIHGHQVTHRCIGQLDDTKGVETHAIDVKDYDDMKSKALFKTNSVQDILRMSLYDLTNATLDAIGKTYTDALIMDLIQEPLARTTNKPKYDVVLIDYFMSEIYLPLAHCFGVPIIFVSVTLPWPFTSCAHDVPYHYFLNLFGLPDSLGIASRTFHFMFYSSVNAFFKHYLFEKMAKSMRNSLPKFPSLQDLSNNVSLIVTGNPYSVNDAVPTTPFMVNVGCVHCQPAKPLPQDLEDVMQGSGEHGVIYFSMGTIVESDWVPPEFLQKIVNGLRQLPQTILWKGQSLNEKNISNFYLQEWFPQQNLLAHDKVRLVISHGGMQSVQQASYHGCPVLGFPLSFDHYYSMKVAKDNGNGEYLNWKTFTTDEFLHTINKMLTNKSYKEAALRASIRMRDVLDSPSAQAAYWTEYVIRHRGAPFLKSDGHHLHWYQYFLLDVIALMATALVLGFMFTSWALKRCVRAADEFLDSCIIISKSI